MKALIFYLILLFVIIPYGKKVIDELWKGKKTIWAKEGRVIVGWDDIFSQLQGFLSFDNFFSMKKLSGIALGFFLLVLLFSWLKQVDTGYRWVKLRFQKAFTRVYQPWLHWKIPFVDSIVLMNVKVQKFESIAKSASKDLQWVQTDIALNYNLMPDKVVELYSSIGNEDIIQYRIISPAIQESVKAATALFTAEELISKRSEVNKTIDENLKGKLTQVGIEVVALNIVDFQFSDAFNRAIEDKVRAEQEALTEKNKLEKIKFEAQQKVESAKGRAESVLIEAKAEAEANETIAASLTPTLVKYKGLEKRDGILPKVTSDAGLLLQWEF